MKHCKVWVGMGMGAGMLLCFAVGGEALWHAAPAPQRASILLLGGMLLAGSALYAWKARAARQPARHALGAASAFSQEPWSDTEPMPSPNAVSALPAGARVALLWDTAQRLEARGRLLAAQELYRQARETAISTPEWAARQGEIALAERKVARRLALIRAHRRPRWWAWPRWLCVRCDDEHHAPR